MLNAHRNKTFSSARSEAKRGSIIAWLFGASVRLVLYYSIFLVLFKCPLTTTLPQDFEDKSCFSLCTKIHAGYSHIYPYVEPYYTTYASGYVELSRPYFEHGKHIYLDKVEPKVSTLSEKAHVIIGPYLNRVHSKAEPYLAQIHTLHTDKILTALQTTTASATNLYNTYGVAAVDKIKPWVVKVRDFVSSNIWPRIRSVAETVYIRALVVVNEIVLWIEVKVAPEVKGLYKNTIEPRVSNIYHQIIENSTRATSEDDSDLHATQPLSTEKLKVSSEQTTVSSVATTSIVYSSTQTASVTAQATAEASPSAREAKISSELASWKTVVQDTTKEAFSTFLDDVEAEKKSIIDQVEPEFTRLLRELSKIQSDAVNDLSRMVDSIPTGEEDEEVERTNGKNFNVNPEAIQDEFRWRAESLRDSALAVRHYAEKVANRILDSTEKVRAATLDVLDEFAEVALAEMGRNLVSGDPKQTATTSVPNWKDWKEFRALKDELMDSRQDILDHEINMADVNKLLREAQETANILTQEAAQYLAGLRAKADFTFQQQIVNRRQRAVAQGEHLEDEGPTDAIFYEELESTATYSATASSSEDETEQETDLGQDIPVSILPVLEADQEIEVDIDGGDNPVSILPVLGADEQVDVDIDGGDSPVSILPVLEADEQVEVDLDGGDNPFSILPVFEAGEQAEVDLDGANNPVSILPVEIEEGPEITETKRIVITREVYVTQQTTSSNEPSSVEHSEL